MKHLLYTLLLTVVAASMSAGEASARKIPKRDIVQNLRVFNALFKELNTNYVDTLDTEKSIRTAIDAMLGDIDPYTEYYPADMQDEILSVSTGNYTGVGAYLFVRDGHIEVSEPQYNSPAAKAGVRAGDVILQVDDIEVTPGMPIEDVSKRLRGDAKTTVDVKVRRPFVADSLLDFTITRDWINIDPLPYYGMVNDSIGYIQLTTFNNKSADAVRDALRDMSSRGMRGLILDLRDNGGGLLESAVNIVENFVPKGTEVVSTRGRGNSSRSVYKTTRRPEFPDLPVVVLTNGNTASASEVVAGALQDLDRAVIVGNRSYGKGLVQVTRELPYGGLMKVTVARYYVPSGRLIQAIDYSHRDEDGNVTRIPDSLTNVFYTSKGRPVRDGGGITPDVPVTTPKMNHLIYNVLRDRWAYDYANRFRNTAGVDSLDAATFVITDSIFDDFKAFIDPERFDYDHVCELGLKYLREAAEADGYMNDDVQARFNELETLLRHDLNHDLDHNSKQLREILDSQISQRFFDPAEQTRRTLLTDPYVEEAIAVLISPERYAILLTPPQKARR